MSGIWRKRACLRQHIERWDQHQAKPDARPDGLAVTITWSALDDELAPLHAQAIGSDHQRGDLFNQARFETPRNMAQRILLARR